VLFLLELALLLLLLLFALLLLLLFVLAGGFPSLYAIKDPVEKTRATAAKVISFIFLKLDITTPF